MEKDQGLAGMYLTSTASRPWRRKSTCSAGWGSGMETSRRSQTLEDKDKKRALYRTVPSGWAQIGWVPGFLEGLGIRATDNRLIDFS